MVFRSLDDAHVIGTAACEATHACTQANRHAAICIPGAGGDGTRTDTSSLAFG